MRSTEMDSIPARLQRLRTFVRGESGGHEMTQLDRDLNAIEDHILLLEQLRASGDKEEKKK